MLGFGNCCDGTTIVEGGLDFCLFRIVVLFVYKLFLELLTYLFTIVLGLSELS